MINNIRLVFMEIVNQSSWMDEQSKIKAIEKVSSLFTAIVRESFALIEQARAIRQKVGYPAYLDDSKSTQLQDDYALVSSNRDLQSCGCFCGIPVRVQYLVLEQHVAGAAIESDRESEEASPTHRSELMDGSGTDSGQCFLSRLVERYL